MAVRIRMKKMGRKHRPFFRIVAIDSRQPRDGRFLEELGALGRTASAVRAVSENRPAPETRPVYSRANGYGR